ncbi:retron Ec67 family RNA-directed DNA polymerase/endonuclease [Thalassotalea hakodatensis]|uniref:retron Ec67 family RNA-directed DNA polymerase/endonuclease n=1 Tax=Thalassotalea hakodatensis TaxID=3030492 RepID=UPI0025725F74|nr:retron Ec67 family RNA-directed DNA polymerase/endonuclease [Thalassotalea hakodatensis]
MSKLKALKKSKSLRELAPLLGYQPKAISYILFKIEEDNKYTSFDVPKKSGGKRQISKPSDKLKALQRSLADLLYSCLEELKPNSQSLKSFKGDHKTLPNTQRAKRAVSHGYEKGLSIASNASMHTNKRYVYNIDIKSFFPAFNFGRVRGYFIKNKNFKLHPKVATLIAQIACFKNELPQGSPCSPVISNLICKSLDMELLNIAKRSGCTYTRYVDDLTFSTNLKKFPKEIASKRRFSFNEKQWRLGKATEVAIRRAGFEINSKKCRMQRYTSLQEVTGLTVNKKVNIRNSYYRSVRAMTHSLFKNGVYYRPPPKSPQTQKKGFSELSSKILAYILPWQKSLIKNNETKELELIDSVEPLIGMFAHIYNIKSYRNRFVRKGFRPDIHNGIRTKANGNITFPTIDRSESYEDDNHVIAIDGVKNLYGKLLFFKYFYFLKKPLIVCEGKTDNIYLKCAIERLSDTFPQLAKGDKTSQQVSFFNRTHTNTEMLKLAEGTPGLEYLISIYRRFMNLYKCEGREHPVIFIVDNDDAGKGLINKAKGIRDQIRKAKMITAPRHKNYYFENIYIVSIPSQNSHGENVKDIEDLFDSDTLEKKLGSKTFYGKNKGLDKEKHYSKAHFSEHVILPGKKTINFDEFKPILHDIVDIIQNYDHKQID